MRRWQHEPVTVILDADGGHQKSWPHCWRSEPICLVRIRRLHCAGSPGAGHGEDPRDGRTLQSRRVCNVDVDAPVLHGLPGGDDVGRFRLRLATEIVRKLPDAPSSFRLGAQPQKLSRTGPELLPLTVRWRVKAAEKKRGRGA